MHEHDQEQAQGKEAGAVTIFGRDGCPYTRAAREAFAARGRTVNYTSVRSDPEALNRMLSLTGGAPRIPVIVDGDSVEVGWQGKW
jgi:glutaredoxin